MKIRPTAVAGATVLAASLLAGVAVTAPPTARAGTGEPAAAAASQAGSDAVAGALAVLRGSPNAAKLGFLTDGLGAAGLGSDYGVTVTDVINEENGASHVRMERTFRGLPVIGGDFVVHRSPSGAWDGANATLTDPLTLSVVPVVAAAVATATALTAGHTLVGAPQLAVYARDKTPRLVWDVFTTGLQSDGQTPSQLHSYVDALTGKVLATNQRIVHATGEGHSLYSGTVPLVTTLAAGWYELRDLTRGGGFTADAEDRADECLPIAIPICTSTAPATIFTDKDNIWGSGGPLDRQSAAVDAQHGSNTTWDYFKNVHGRTGVANDGRGVYSRVHYGRSYANAFWNDDCVCMTFGDGDGIELGPLVSIDIAGHEITHGIIYRTARFANSGESGGLSESTADIFGTMIEFYANNGKDGGDYLIGEKVFRRTHDKEGRRNAIRFMDRPSRDMDSPDCWSPGLSSAGVHQAAGIGNHFFYLLSEGSGKKVLSGVTYNSPTCDGQAVTGIGNAAAAKIWYRALVLHMTSSSSYSDARLATRQAAAALFGATSKEAKAVEKAWNAVNVHIRDAKDFR